MYPRPPNGVIADSGPSDPFNAGEGNAPAASTRPEGSITVMEADRRYAWRRRTSSACRPARPRAPAWAQLPEPRSRSGTASKSRLVCWPRRIHRSSLYPSTDNAVTVPGTLGSTRGVLHGQRRCSCVERETFLPRILVRRNRPSNIPRGAAAVYLEATSLLTASAPVRPGPDRARTPSNADILQPTRHG